jgi:hypothetical protein
MIQLRRLHCNLSARSRFAKYSSQMEAICRSRDVASTQNGGGDVAFWQHQQMLRRCGVSRQRRRRTTDVLCRAQGSRGIEPRASVPTCVQRHSAQATRFCYLEDELALLDLGVGSGAVGSPGSGGPGGAPGCSRSIDSHAGISATTFKPPIFRLPPCMRSECFVKFNVKSGMQHHSLLEGKHDHE